MQNASNFLQPRCRKIDHPPLKLVQTVLGRVADTNKDMFLNKMNIVNVSISRARDYLFILMPDDNTENVGNLSLIKKVERLCKEQPVWSEQQPPAIEEIMFGSKTYLEDNSFSTSHQLVNVYGKPEKRYEVRSEDNAVDVQIHE